MPSISRHELTHSAIVIAGTATEAELSIAAEMLSRHPGCERLPRLELDLVGRLADLASYADSLMVRDDGGAGIPPQLRNTWERVLRIELGNAVIRSASKMLLQKSGALMIATGKGLAGLEEFPRFFPTVPLVLLLGEGEKPWPVEELGARLRSLGHPVTLLPFQDLKSDPVRVMTRLLDFAGLPAVKFPWAELETAQPQLHR